MTSILASIVSLIVAVMGVLFSKSGERTSLNKISYILLLLVVLSGGFTIYQAYTKSGENESLRVSLSTANKSIEDVKGELAGAKKQLEAANVALTSLRGATRWAQTQATLQKASERHRDLRVLFRRNVQELQDDEKADLPGFVGPSPIEEDNVRKVTFKFYIQEVLSEEFVFEKRNGKVFFRAPDADEVQLEPCVASCAFRMKSKHWRSGVYAYVYSHSIHLPITDSGVRALTYVGDASSVGFIEIDHDGKWDAGEYARKMNSNISMQFKAYKVHSIAEIASRNKAAISSGTQPCSEPIVAGIYVEPAANENKTATLIMRTSPLIYIACERTPF
ncbi:hypothetical protein OOZ54_13835 [Rhodopseudomonas palustris]|uniref:hypothetical protein n=1 Tax=Rhodopseudomonas palustris TaxID=1076 RepID=UPI0022F02B13|nr:hypothetical protein [Rhodopseudomonas palustris]WBU27745.1 hypothetical protein OOZ54_13835 [Rhodopseudomonas palustris]